jgi:uncharacterized membrane-anchored protein YhcB (DUF1043 family)
MNSSTDLSGPCLPWCFSYNRTKYIIIGIIIGIMIYHLYLQYMKSKTKKNKKNKN